MGNRFQAPLAFLRRHPIRALTVLVLVALFGVVDWMGSRRLQAERHLRAAQQAAERRDFAQAREHLAVCLQIMPDNGRVHFLAAQTARRAGDLDLAQEHLRACRRLGFESQAVELEWALLAAKRGHFAEQEALLWSLVEQDHPDMLLILEVLIDGYIQHYRMPRALRCLDLYLERESEDVQAWLGRGWVCERLFYWTDVVQSYRRAANLDPANEPARLRLAKALLITGPPDKAAEEFETLHQKRPDDTEVLLGLARCRRQQGRLEDADRLLDELTSRHPQDGAVLKERGRLAIDAGDAAGAETWLRKAVARSPHDREARYDLYQCLQQQGKEKEAQESLSIFQRLDADLKRIDWLTQQMQKTPYDLELYHEAGVLCLRNGSAEEGVRWLRLALQYDPRHRPSHLALADYYQSAGRLDLAAQHQQLAQSLAKRKAIGSRK
jgi:tetratricopeptide (TPR) repeat protein